MSRTAGLWLLWLVSSLAGGAVLVLGMIYGGGSRAHLLIGATTSGHHQIELACEACHTTPFGGGPVLQTACVNCHGEDLKQAKDAHPAKKFADPRNADRLAKLAAQECVTCHREHRPEITHAMGVTLPMDYCALCHKDVGKDRPSHAGLAFDTCASAGCHNYHDNRALYEDFLDKHADDPATKLKAFVKLRMEDPEPTEERKPLARADADAPAEKLADDTAMRDWLATAHAKAGVNCSGCHVPGKKKDEAVTLANWVASPDHKVCATCHAPEAKGFTQGKHGMRLAAGLKGERSGLFGLYKDKPLSPMRPELAWLPMSPKAHGIELGCSTCHKAHGFDTARAQVEGCLTCHADEHSKAYAGSPHEKLWRAELAGTGERATGVSCATCHMPRMSVEDEDGVERVVANHNQNDNLRPNEKMARSVCLDCHGLRLTLDALADPALVRRNFSGRPAIHVESIDWVVKRRKEREAKQQQSATTDPGDTKR